MRSSWQTWLFCASLLGMGGSLLAQPEYNLVYPTFQSTADCDGGITYDAPSGVPVGSSQTFVFTVRNDGDEPLVLQLPITMERGEAYFITQQPDEVIPPGENSIMLVVFEPPCPGRYRDRFTVNSNDPDEPACSFRIDHHGLGEGPLLIVFDFDLERMVYPSAEGATFGPVDPDAADESHLLWLTNVGTEPVLIETWEAPPGFSVTPKAGTVLEPEQRTSALLYYRPEACGATDTGKLAVGSNSLAPTCYEPATEFGFFPLRGTTLPCESGDAAIQLYGNGIARKCGATVYFFGNQTQTIRIENQGTATLDIADVYLSDDRYILLSEPSPSIPPGGYTEFAVAVAPACGGFCSTYLYIISNDPDEGSCRLRLLGNYSPDRDSRQKTAGNSTAPPLAFPNPAGNALTLELPASKSDRDYRLFDLRGSSVQSGTVPAGASHWGLSLQGLPPGQYALWIEGNNQPLRITKK